MSVCFCVQFISMQHPWKKLWRFLAAVLWCCLLSVQFSGSLFDWGSVYRTGLCNFHGQCRSGIGDVVSGAGEQVSLLHLHPFDGHNHLVDYSAAFRTSPWFPAGAESFQSGIALYGQKSVVPESGWSISDGLFQLPGALTAREQVFVKRLWLVLCFPMVW